MTHTDEPGKCDVSPVQMGLLIIESHPKDMLVKAWGRSLASASLGRAEGCMTGPSWPQSDQAEEMGRAHCSLFGKVLAS